MVDLHHDPVRWEQHIRGHMADYTRCSTHAASAQRLKSLVKSQWLDYADMKARPEVFFKAHRLLASLYAGGFGIRFTVQYNLFVGSILALGGPEQIAKIESYQRDGTLGCFALTEVSAGVNSGLIVTTTVTWDVAASEFVLNTPDSGARKNWISQGLHAELAVVFADLIVGEKHWGLHPFLVRLRDAETGAVTKGITITEMGLKTVANDLDNVTLSFDNVQLAKDSLLNRFCDITDGAYEIKGERLRIEIIGSRLLTGRLCIAQAAIVFSRSVMQQTRDYTLRKDVHILGGTTKLGLLPQLKNLYADADEKFKKMEHFAAETEARLVKFLKTGEVPDPATVEAISVCKIRVIQDSIEINHRLKQEVGSYALMRGTGFEDSDMLQCCKFAEGDSRILMQKIARDKLLGLLTANPVVALAQVVSELGSWNYAAEMRRTLALAVVMKAAGSREKAWNSNLEGIFELAEVICERYFSTCSNQHTFDCPVEGQAS